MGRSGNKRIEDNTEISSVLVDIDILEGLEGGFEVSRGTDRLRSCQKLRRPSSSAFRFRAAWLPSFLFRFRIL